ncbi:cation:H+ antiporter [Natronoarchaeum philippinense]|uniref:Cation:H+ antiporter n=2 Tax=Natronoarchaeum philippinense TaxID=558529 RepID=A0A285P6K2_NATPI|nr:sodium:calcium antiporter [Natronoarchaeum philippinense]SNZ17360.1 cation:H+ antiporter [Natronoarchaeum philippinense]
MGVVVAVLLSVPWVVVYAVSSPEAIGTVPTVAVSGLSVLGASFLLAWGAETAEKDVPRAFAIAVLAILAVAPEYAVDAFYAWQAGQGRVGAGDLAVANMTGANRILIGLGWSGIALFSIYRATRSGDAAVEHNDGILADAVVLDRDIATEILFLMLATLWAFFVPLGGGIDTLDLVVLVGLYVVYIGIIIRGGADDGEVHVGVPAYLQKTPANVRIPSIFALFGYSGFLIFTAVEPFAHGLENIGLQYGIPEFFMIQWVAPLASESPELIVTAYLVNKARTTAAFNALISSKLNQWTLLIGTLGVVFSISQGAYGVLEFSFKQSAEIWLTAAQSFFALAILINFRITVREAVVLLVLFVSQVGIEFLLIDTISVGFTATDLLLAYTAVYLLLGSAMFVARFDNVRHVGSLAKTNVFADGQPADSD